MRICSPHCGVDPETTSGGETYERELLRHLAQGGMSIEIMLARHKKYPADIANSSVYRLPIGRGLRWPIAAVVLPAFIARRYRATAFDLLRVHSIRYIGPAALLARRRYHVDVPIVAHHHHLDPNPFNGLIERRVIEAVERVITVSEFSKRQLINELRVDGANVDVVPNGIDSTFGPGVRDPALARRLGVGSQPVVLFLGGLKGRKNLSFLIDVWSEIASIRPTARLVIAGAGPMQSSLQARVKSAQVANSVIFTGRVQESEKVAYYNLADVFVSPSSLEGFGFSVAEAMSCGRPVVVSAAGALPELVADGEGGFVCPNGDRARFVKSLLTLLDDPELRRRYGEFNRARVDARYRWDRCSKRIEQIYEQTWRDWRRNRISGRT
jgi:glycosyltransferase involved in cell wall biosynthesis